MKSAVMASTRVECLTDSSDTTLDVTGIFSSDNSLQNEQQVTGTPKYVVCVSKVDNLRRVSTPCGLVGDANQEDYDYDSLCSRLLEVGAVDLLPLAQHYSDEDNVCRCGLVEISIPNRVRELCTGCFSWCKSLRRVTFGPSSLLERIGVSCFQDTGVEEVSVTDGVRELCDGCFRGCKIRHGSHLE